MTLKFRLYSRAGCHLCDEMLRDLEAFLHSRTESFTVEVQDIDRDPEMQRRYCLRVPVLTAGDSGEVLCEAHFNRRTVLDYLVTNAQ